ncbi:potassium-transporting ATPase subunit A [Erysipelothrix sp. HDW6C]|uniref:potassium-transporting ATPase subunit KdpA n=1 Tax=Erysipelothrix sp. HDW6C TaxID=2714930 RepID=UPI0014096A12|nr:potassium-transporting ATPase subunit KdpA [Erysipelothrix sp. HDW6C]QIK70790.1 potassium-transporting ATPase subunit A [Erysipelothrix sp. HDW6C]
MGYSIIFCVLAACAMYGAGRYLYLIMNNRPLIGDRVLRPFEKFMMKMMGSRGANMGWKQYFFALFGMNMMLGLIGFILIMILSHNLMNPGQALNTIVSFITNTNLQHYAGETGLTLMTQMLVIITMMFVSSASGIAVGFAFIRALTGSEMGNFYADLIRILTRFLLPLSIFIGLLLVWQGVPQTIASQIHVTTITGQTQTLNVGPVAALEAIKHLGTNGGGYFGASSAMPFENPTIITNIINMIAMTLVPGGLLVAFGMKAYDRKKDRKHTSESTPLLVVSALFFFICLAIIILSETKGNPIFSQLGLENIGNLEGKELRFGVIQSSLFSTVSSAFTTGSVNAMHDSLTPMGGFVPLFLMMLNVVFGGSGVGFMNLIMYVLLTVFICGLMIGRTPEYLGKKIESNEMKRVAMVIIIHPLLILGFSAIALMVVGNLSGTHHSFTQVLYEFTSSAANNGSGFEGLVDNTTFWNLSTGVVMMIARYATMYLQLNVAGLLLRKQSMAQSSGTLRTNTGIFTIALVVIIVLISALTFFPALILGPISEALMLGL